MQSQLIKPSILKRQNPTAMAPPTRRVGEQVQVKEPVVKETRQILPAIQQIKYDFESRRRINAEFRQKINATRSQLIKIQKETSDQYSSFSSLNAGMAFRQRKEDLREQDFRVLENDLTDIKELSAQFDDHTSSLRSNLEVFISTLAPVKDLFATFQHKLEEAQRKDNERQNDLGVTEHNCALLTAELTDAKTRDDDLSKSLDLLDIDQRAKVSRVQLLNVELNKTKEKDTEISLKLIDVQNEKEALLLKIRQLESATQEELEPLNQSLQLAREKKNEICDTTELNKVAVENIMKLYRDTCEEHKFLSSALDQKKSLLQELLDLEEQDDRDVQELNSTLHQLDMSITFLASEVDLANEKFESSEKELASVEMEMDTQRQRDKELNDTINKLRREESSERWNLEKAELDFKKLLNEAKVERAEGLQSCQLENSVVTELIQEVNRLTADAECVDKKVAETLDSIKTREVQLLEAEENLKTASTEDAQVKEALDSFLSERQDLTIAIRVNSDLSHELEKTRTMIVADKKTVKEYIDEIKKISASIDQLHSKTQNARTSSLADENKVTKLRQTLEEIKALPLQFSDLEVSRKRELEALQKQVDEKKLCFVSSSVPSAQSTTLDSEDFAVKRNVSRVNSARDINLVSSTTAPPPSHDVPSTSKASQRKTNPPVIPLQKSDGYGSDSDQSDAFFGNKPLVPKLTPAALKLSTHALNNPPSVIKLSAHKVGGGSAVAVSETRRVIREVSLADKLIAKTLLREKDNKQQPGSGSKIDRKRRVSDGWYDGNEDSFDKL